MTDRYSYMVWMIKQTFLQVKTEHNLRSSLSVVGQFHCLHFVWSHSMQPDSKYSCMGWYHLGIILWNAKTKDIQVEKWKYVKIFLLITLRWTRNYRCPVFLLVLCQLKVETHWIILIFLYVFKIKLLMAVRETQGFDWGRLVLSEGGPFVAHKCHLLKLLKSFLGTFLGDIVLSWNCLSFQGGLLLKSGI